ncbi:hypothetical protein COT72_03245 [archaeon CG10_big_fil_rev_8_21_14_0_10_43_11]|nr:MAG: hypothetical protein COT72_03245 [archaeon CG10_big_fil_rev_8_21_14_0_10_43_11]
MSRLEEFLRVPDALISFKTTFFREPYLMSSYYLLMDRYLLEHERVRVGSIASSDGKEAYSLSMIHLLLPKHMYEIHGFDINPAGIKTAREGCYTMTRTFDDLLRGLSYVSIKQPELDATRDELLSFFSKQQAHDTFTIPSCITRPCTFHVMDVMDVPKTEGYDAIMCQNFVYHFKKEGMLCILEKLAGMIKPGGVLVLDAWYPPENEYHARFNEDYFEVMRKTRLFSQKNVRVLSDFSPHK